MILELHMSAPGGEALRRMITSVLNVLKDDNRLVIAALLNAGTHVPDTITELGLQYKPPGPEEALTPTQDIHGLLSMVGRGTFSCGDAAAYEAAVQEEKYGHRCACSCVAQGSNAYHAIYFGPKGPVDPTENWLRHYAKANNISMTAATGADRWERLKG